MLLRAGGEMLHGVDIGFPSNRGVIRLLQTAVFDALPSWITGKVRRKWPLLSPRGYVKLVFDTLGINEKVPGEFSVFNVAINSEILTENYAIGLNRIVKDSMTDYRYGRAGAILLRIKKT